MTLGYLQLHPNRHSRVRADGLKYWGHPTRSKPVQVIVVHTAEIDPGPGSAESIARYFTFSTRPASYHEVGDANSHVVCLPPDATAFGAVGWNSNGWHYSFATRAHLWGRDTAWDTAALEVGAERCRAAADRHGIPVRRITLTQAQRGVKGFIDHDRLDPGRRTDPGVKFPWDRFLKFVAGTHDQEDDVYAIRFGDQSPYVERVQRLMNVAAPKAEMAVSLKEDGDYGPKTAGAVDLYAQRARLPRDGDRGCHVLVVDYLRNWLSG